MSERLSMPPNAFTRLSATESRGSAAVETLGSGSVAAVIAAD